MEFKPSLTRASRRGYGLAMLMIFITSSILVGTSLQMMGGPTTLAFLGQSSQNNLSARQIASMALNAALVDIQSKLNSGQSVTTSYRLPSSGTTAVTVPTYPGSGANATVGEYYVTATKARGNAFVLQATATVNGTTVQVSKFLQMARNNNFIMDSMSTGMSAAYSVRRLRSGYTGSAIRVRRSSDNAEQDIGFTPNGDLDTTALQAFIGVSSDPLAGGVASEKPLDTVTGASAAYSLRKLRTAYAGSAFRLLRASDDSVRDIGFNADGTLKTSDINPWMGASNGRVTIWYDQSGNGRDVIQPTHANRPVAVLGGVINTLNGLPTFQFSTPTPNAAGQDGHYLYRTASTTPAQSVNAVVSMTGTKAEMYVFAIPESGTATFELNRIGAGTYNTPTVTTDWYYNTGTPSKIWVNGSQTTSGASNAHIVTATAASAKNTTTTIGRAYNLTSLYQASVSELIIFPTELSTTNRQYLEKNQAAYYGISGGSAGGTGYITTWYDQSGNGKHVVQATAANQPEIMVLGPGATAIRPAVKFSGSDYLSVTTGFPTSSDYSISAILSCASASTCNNAVSSNTGHALHAANASAVTTSYFKLHHNGANFVDSSTAMPVNNPFAIFGTFVNSSRLGTLYQGGVSVGSGTASTSNSDATIHVGAFNGSWNWNNGTISEAIVFSRVLSATERNALYMDQQAYFGAL